MPLTETCCTHDCNQGRDCPQRTAAATARTCAALGLCQSRTPACGDCKPQPTPVTRHYFAPGTIDGGPISGGSSDLQPGAEAGWVLELRWYDWLAGAAIVLIVGLIAGARL
jgi:hypothetical protein